MMQKGRSMQTPPVSPLKALRGQLPAVETRYKGLRRYTDVLRLAAVLVVAGSAILAVLATLSAGSYQYFSLFLTALAVLFGGFFLGLSLWALGDFLELQIAREEQARITNELLLRLLK